jgi:hypothetical protein
MAAIILKWFNAREKRPSNLNWVILWAPSHPIQKTRDWLKVCEYREEVGFVDQERNTYEPKDFRKLYWCRWRSPTSQE